MRTAFIRSTPISWALPLALAACSALPGTPRAVPRYDAATFYETTTVRGVSIAPAGDAVLFTSDKSGVFNAWQVPAQGGEPQMLTDSTTDAISGISFFPDDRRLLFQKDEGGNELVHVYVRELDGRVVDITPGNSLKASFVKWSGDDASMFIQTNERDPRYFDLYRYSASDYTRTLMFENQGGFELGDVSLDGRYLALNKTNDNADGDLFLWSSDQAGQPPRRITPHSGKVSYEVTAFAADSHEIFFTSDQGSEFLRLWGQNLDTGEQRMVFEAPWDVQSVSFSRDGRYRIVTVNADARTQLTIVDLKSGKPLALPELRNLDVQEVDISRDGKRLACLALSDTSPANLFVIDIGQSEARQVTHTLNPAVDEDALVRAEVIRFKSQDGLEIPSLLYRPLQASSSNRVPALLWIHGGPGGQSRTAYSAFIQHLVNNGVAVLSVNNRGSSGYGKTFHHLDDRKHGEVDLDDCVWAKKWLAGQDWCDSANIGISGGSYGGYMVLAALTYRPEEFTIGIDLFGVANWLRTLESVPPWWASFKDSLYAEIGDPVADRERLQRQSPLFHADKIRRPLLVVQGANDPRVLQVESDEIVAACKRNGVPVEYLLFPDEGHGFQRKANRIAASQAMLTFVEQYMKTPPAAAPARLQLGY
ncbi:MAG: prolyl oligopeptidase family serine peptidase [Planctomycetota bacterium]